jgi:hypothetical protein
MLHSKVTASVDDEKLKVADVELVVPDGPASILVSGARTGGRTGGSGAGGCWVTGPPDEPLVGGASAVGEDGSFGFFGSVPVRTSRPSGMPSRSVSRRRGSVCETKIS